MYVILVYDVNQKRTNKVLKIARKYLNWVQNSVLEGEISPAKLEKLKFEISKVIEDNDSVVIYTFPYKSYKSREVIGSERGGVDIII